MVMCISRQNVKVDRDIVCTCDSVTNNAARAAVFTGYVHNEDANGCELPVDVIHSFHGFGGRDVREATLHVVILVHYRELTRVAELGVQLLERVSGDDWLVYIKVFGHVELA
jgi:hypothetical protein